MSGNSVENSQANCSPRGWFRITLKHRATVVKMKGREGGREGEETQWEPCRII
jgi:hypothetical protein